MQGGAPLWGATYAIIHMKEHDTHDKMHYQTQIVFVVKGKDKQVATCVF